jgi:hypothetical protein
MELGLNLSEILQELKFRKPAQSEFDCELSETEAYSSHFTMTKMGDYFTTDFSEMGENEFYN